MREHNHPIAIPDPQLRILLDTSPIAMLVFNDRGEIVAANLPASALFGTPPYSSLPLACGDFLHCAHWQKNGTGDRSETCDTCQLRAGVHAALAGTAGTHDLDGEIEVERAPGTNSLWLRYAIRPVAMDNHRGVLLTAYDISGLRRSEQQYHMLFREMLNAFALHEVICDSKGVPVDYRFLAVNPAFEQMTGLRAARAVGQTVLTLLPDTEPYWIDTYGQVGLTGKPVRFESYSQELNKFFSVSAFSPTPGQVACLFEDITARKNAEMSLQESEARIRAITDSAKDAIIMMDERGLISFWNPAAEGLLGYSREEAIGAYLHRLLAPRRYHDVFARAFLQFQQNGHGRAIGRMLELEARHKNKYEIPIELSLAAIRRGGGWHTVGILRDITERKRSESQIRQSESRLRHLVDILQHPAESASAFLDYALEQALALTGSRIGFISHYHEERRELVLNSWSSEVATACTLANPQTHFPLDRAGLWGEVIRQRRPIVVNEYQAKHQGKHGYPQGHVDLHRFMSVPVFRDERIVGVVGLGNKETDYDETDQLQVSLLMDSIWSAVERKQMEEERRRLQAQLAQAQKMEAIGTLAGGIAHDFNNILGAILGYAEMARDGSNRGAPVIRELDKVLEAGHRAAALVRQILAFSRQGESRRAPIDPAPIVKEVVKLLRPSLPSTIAIHQRIAATRPVLADPTQLHQILMNLCTNAFHAMEEQGGELEIGLAQRHCTAVEIAGNPGLDPGDFVVLTVTDTGPGISPEVRARMFDPYFTTKETGKGTGMGLAIVHGIVSEYGGFITCDSEPGRGTTFRVLLPAIDGEAVAAPGSEAAISTGQGRVLLIDDEEMLAEMGQAMLERLGYEVRVCTGSAEALAVFEHNPEQFDAVITDQTMPGLTGIELARAMLLLRPDLPIILCTGYSNLVDEGQAKAVGIHGFAMKPLAMKDLADLLRSALNRANTCP